MKRLVSIISFCAVPFVTFAADGDEKMSPVVACQEFRDRFTTALAGNREGIALASLFTGPKQEKFDVLGIQAAIGCTSDGMFEGIGASLIETDDSSIRRFARFSAAALRATVPSFEHAQSVQFMADLAKEALGNARDNEWKSGQLWGDAEKHLGPYVVMHGFHNGLARIGIELRYKD